MKSFFHSKKANVSITILVLIVFAICALTLLSFFIANKNAESEFKKVRLVSVGNFLANQDEFYSSFGLDLAAILDESFISTDSKFSSPFNSYQFAVINRGGQRFLTASYYENSGFLWLQKKETVYAEYPLN